MGIIAFEQIRNAMFCYQKGAAHINGEHQVEPFCFCLNRIGQLDSRCIVDENINTAEFICCLLYCSSNLFFLPDIYLHCQGMPACLLHFLCGGINGTTQAGSSVTLLAAITILAPSAASFKAIA